MGFTALKHGNKIVGFTALKHGNKIVGFVTDCGINAHKHCKDLVVMECRSKANVACNRRLDSLSSNGKFLSNLGSDIRNMFSGFSTKYDSNQPVQLNRLARIVKLCLKQS